MPKGSRDTATSRKSTRIAAQPVHQHVEEQEESMDVDSELPTPKNRRDRKQEEDEEDDYESVDDEEDHSMARRKKGERDENWGLKKEQRRGRGSGLSVPGESSSTKEGKRSRKKIALNEMGVLLPHDEMLHNSLLYLLLMQHKKIPAKKSDMIKHAMNGQSREFEDVFKELETVLNDIFGIKVIGIGDTQKSGLYPNYILVSNYNLSVCDMVTSRDHDVDCRRSILFLILTVIFMLNRSIDEDLIWKVMNDTKLNSLVCEKKDNLRRFLKQEYVTTMYLNLEENNDNDPPIVRYSWGCRADKEYSKYSILKFVTKQFPGKKPYDFTIQYGVAKETEGELVAADAAIEEREAEKEAENYPPLEGSLLDEDDDLMSQNFRRDDSDSDDEESRSEWKRRGTRETMEAEDIDSGREERANDDSS